MRRLQTFKWSLIPRRFSTLTPRYSFSDPVCHPENFPGSVEEDEDEFGWPLTWPELEESEPQEPASEPPPSKQPSSPAVDLPNTKKNAAAVTMSRLQSTLQSSLSPRHFSTLSPLSSRIDSIPNPTTWLKDEITTSIPPSSSTAPLPKPQSQSSTPPPPSQPTEEPSWEPQPPPNRKPPPPPFEPRTTFTISHSINRTYFLGHHVSALTSMRATLSRINLIIEARDFRVPLSSLNPGLDRVLAGRPRIIVYTKCDLGPRSCARTKRKLTTWHTTHNHARYVLFHGDDHGGITAGPQTTNLLKAIGDLSQEVERSPVLGAQALVVGMPNAGKSSLLNLLRRHGMGSNKETLLPGQRGTKTISDRRGGRITILKKAAKTAATPGVTRKLSSPIRILPRKPGSAEQDIPDEEGVLLLDTPGVFVPYISTPEDMVKLSLVGMVKDGIVDAHIIADYLLYRLNLRNPLSYSRWCHPTNSVNEWLDRIAIRTGKLGKKGSPRTEAAAEFIIQKYRDGELGRFVLDGLTEGDLDAAQGRLEEAPRLSVREAKGRVREAKRERARKVRDAEDAADAAGG